MCDTLRLRQLEEASRRQQVAGPRQENLTRDGLHKRRKALLSHTLPRVGRSRTERPEIVESGHWILALSLTQQTGRAERIFDDGSNISTRTLGKLRDIRASTRGRRTRLLCISLARRVKCLGLG